MEELKPIHRREQKIFHVSQRSPIERVKEGASCWILQVRVSMPIGKFVGRQILADSHPKRTKEERLPARIEDVETKKHASQGLNLENVRNAFIQRENGDIGGGEYICNVRIWRG